MNIQDEGGIKDDFGAADLGERILVPNGRTCVFLAISIGLGDQRLLTDLRISFEFGKKSYSCCRDLEILLWKNSHKNFSYNYRSEWVSQQEKL